jgi:hypothetical protein
VIFSAFNKVTHKDNFETACDKGYYTTIKIVKNCAFVEWSDQKLQLL